MRVGVVAPLAIIVGCGWTLAANDLPDRDKLGPGNSFVEFVTRNKASIVNIANVNTLDSSQIRGLEVNEGQFVDWPALGSKLTNVVCLRLATSATHLSANLFRDITNIPRLEYLQLQCRKAVLIPTHVNLLTNLQHLRYFGVNAPEARDFDSGLYRVGTLRELFLIVGEVSLPKGITRLTKLEHMVIYGKRTRPILGLPEDLPQSMLQRLEFASVPGLEKILPALPPNLVEFRALRCQLTGIPEKWLKGRRLAVVDLSDNQLTAVPTGLLDISTLRLMGLDLNNITYIPPLNIASGRQLKVSLIGNPIQHVAPENKPLVERGIIEM